MTRAEAPDPPLVEPLAPYVPPELALERLAHLPKVLFLDSALADGRNGRYSFLCADPIAWLECYFPEDAPLNRLAEELAKYSAARVAGLPPFQGGAAGLFSYELAHSLERIPPARYDEFQLPLLAVGIYDVVVAYDRLSGEGWLISQGIPATEPRARQNRSEQRLRFFQDELRSTGPRSTRRPVEASAAARLSMSSLAPQYATARSGKLTSNFSHSGYLAAVQRCIDYICSGDVFQVNLSHRLLHPALEDSLRLYQRLRELNAAPMAAYFDLGSAQIISASPERFVRVVEGAVETRPIKGTRTRSIRPEADLFSGDELKQSEKDRAENVMIVDLMRNDLARVCLPESVEVTQLCELETFAYVQHLVSSIRGRLREGLSSLDLIRAAFPGGSITGAPKIRSMEIIAELEPTARGAYCGAIGYIGLDGTLDTSILIRTITAARGWWQLPVGGGVIAQSNPQFEYEETWHKAEGLLRSLPTANAS